MKCISIAIATLFVALASTASAQDSEEIGGGGTPGFIPQFTGTHKIGNSNIFQSSNGNIGIGWPTPNYPLQIFTNTLPNALYVQNNGACAPSPCVVNSIFGFAGGNSGTAIGVNGQTNSPGGIGVIGNQPISEGGGGGGVLGLTNAANGFAYAIRGDALGTTGSAVAVFGSSFSPESITAYFVNRAYGDIIHGAVSQGYNGDVRVFRVDGTGKVFANGGFQPNGADFAESIAVSGERSKYAAGDLLAIDPTADRHLKLAQQAYSTLVAGIYSTKPGILGTTRGVDERAANDEVPLAVVGIVPCKVTTENGSIQAGDLLVSSSTPGHAMKGTDRSKMLGSVVGKALEPLQQGTGVIQVLVTLQ